jgi:hypothetical protein
MLNKALKLKSRKILAVAGLGLALTGCGRQDSTVTANWGSNGQTCPAGQVHVFPWGCVNNGSSGGFFMTNTPCHTQQMGNMLELSCYVSPASYSGSVPNLPYLPSASQTNEAWWGPEVRAGDQVSLVGSLRVGSAYLGSLFGDCKDEQSAAPILRGAVGSSYFSLPLVAEGSFGASGITVNASGYLRFGVSERKSCYEAGSIYVRILRPAQ